MSAGVAIHPLDGKKVEALLHHADSALYEAKKSGGNQYRFYKKNQKVKV